MSDLMKPSSSNETQTINDKLRRLMRNDIKVKEL